ncbi:hypothetical protein L207DRAFT_505973 [Hyaloscypha variabilis F]|uniref:Protein NO VEIN C-terminal domain-containing protein n=1 Tax=Hyaloscypha variabilis (strain UAMH 11265 / GT02V1 / F) TaxID=1149755 RepID=A0A2J6SE09_HYAVF|nr:hypothetical protein L207DRAFT_505973 [Hyaloscypha variabilis F]
MATPIPTEVQMKQEADDHLRDIRRRKGVDLSDGQQSDNVEDLNRALNILSDELYTKPTHFLLELIQNADDNNFKSDDPTISMILNNDYDLVVHYLRIDCNEVGFTKANVEALCRIGASTKKSRERSTGYIGEKGIGFKSIFKVAETVHISSKGYAFKFDRHGMLGMIVPVIEAFPPSHLKAGQTQTFLNIKSLADFNDIRTELEKLEPQILIFLRKIRKLIIHPPGAGGKILRIQRLDQDDEFDGGETAILKSNYLKDDSFKRQKYVIVRYNMTDLEKDHRRENITATEIVLAFRIDHKMRPVLRAQKTYAFLPIDNYGFNYLIQGDFLLVANRESVDSSKWNYSVRVGVYRAFVSQAVPRFNAIHSNAAGVRYTWPLFLKDRGGTDEFWSTLKRWIFSGLSKRNVLECRHNTKLTRPNSLFYIPLEFRFEGKPLVEDESTESNHLSFAYDADINQILPELQKMGVKVLSFSDFISELRSLVTRRGFSFLKEQPGRWHSQVAGLFLNSHVRASQLEGIPLIPLRDGRWVTSSERHIFLEEDTDRAAVPDGLDINLVDAEACRDPIRKTFFGWLGIKDCDQAEVCKLIMQRYNPFHPLSLRQSSQDLIYLFQVPWNVYKESLGNLQLLPAPPHDDGFRKAKRFYIEYPGRSSILSKYAMNLASNFALLDPYYLNAVRNLGKETEFIDWACFRLEFSTQPRLIDDSHNLTTEFIFLSRNAVMELILLLRDNWNIYRDQLKPILIAAISEVLVDCTDGLPRRLEETILPLEILKLGGPNLPFIAIPEPNDPRWRRFSLFGVLVEQSVVFYLRQLKTLASLPDSSTTSKLSVQNTYKGLQRYLEPSQGVVKDNFARHPLVFIEGLKRWVFLHDCVWSGPRLPSVHYLSTEYPQCKELFRNHLNVGNVNLGHVIRELECVNGSTSTDQLEKLLLHLNVFLGKAPTERSLSKLKGKKIIPVMKPDGTVCRMTYDLDRWYLADRQKLRECFNGKLPLITFDVSTVRKLNPLIKAMNLSKFLLSIADEQTLEANGDKIYDEKRSLELRRRGLYFQRLMNDKPLRERRGLASRVEKLQVWGVSAIKLSHKVDGITGAADTSSLLFDYTDQTNLDITYVLNLEPAILNFELSKVFIEICGISNEKLAKLVLPILTFPLGEIDNLLDSYGLDSLGDLRGHPADTVDSVSELSEDDDAEDSLIRETVPTALAPDTPPRPPHSSPSSFLRDRIPALDARISSVQAAAAHPTMTPTVIISPSQRTNIPKALMPSVHSNSNEISSSSTPSIGGIGLDPHETNLEGPSTLSASRHGPSSSYSAFEFRDMSSALSDVFATTTPSSNNGTSIFRQSQRLRFSHSSHSPNTEPEPNHTMQGIYNQYVGLQGEVFINEWLSRNLDHEWDATRHWTSRNRNQIYPNNPFVGKEGGFADFTYKDTSGKLTEILSTLGFIRDVETWSQCPPIYHLEVKSTLGPCIEPFYMSNNQVEKARTYAVSWDSDSIPTDVYVILRVYDLEKETSPGFTAYVDPWTMYMKRELNFMARDTFMVTINR